MRPETKIKSEKVKPNVRNQIIDALHGVLLFILALAGVYFLVIYTLPTVQASQPQKKVTCVVELVKHNETSQLEGSIK